MCSRCKPAQSTYIVSRAQLPADNKYGQTAHDILTRFHLRQALMSITHLVSTPARSLFSSVTRPSSRGLGLFRTPRTSPSALSLSLETKAPLSATRTMVSQPNWEITESVKQNPILASTMEAMHRIAPLSLAELSFDNVGVLLQAPPSAQAHAEKQGVMLAIDLTTDVCDEILASPHNIKVAIVYHPTIFHGLKSLTFADPQQRSLLRLAAAGVSVFCPHTSLDAVPGGINDWLAKVVSTKDAFAQLESDEALQSLRSEVHPFLSKAKDAPQGYEAAGLGRLVQLKEAQSFEEIVRRVKQNLDLPHVQGLKGSDKPISTIAICAGSGSVVFSGVKADLCTFE